MGGPDLFIKIDQFHEAFCADLRDDVAGPMAVSQRPLAAAGSPRRLDPSVARSSSLVYGVRARQRDPPDRERFMAQRTNAVTETVDGSHAAFISQPDVASGLILKAIASL